MTSRGKNLLLALIFSFILMVVVVAGYNIIPEPTLKRFFQMLGGSLPGGLIQFFTYIAFFWGIFEIRARMHRLQFEEAGLKMGLLPEKEQWVLSPNDVNDLKLKMIEKEQERKLLITDVIKKASTKFRANRNISDVMGIVSAQIKINMSKAESAQSIIRYLAWAMPSIGFIGTIMGIAQALGVSDKVADDPEMLGQVTAYMYVAFDTTLIALFLSIIMMWYFHSLQEREEDLHSEMEEYVMENLVNRIHLE
ncbi:MAG: MotA/TolQ/ExbB proton channel family protein [Chitinophagales bacterium]